MKTTWGSLWRAALIVVGMVVHPAHAIDAPGAPPVEAFFGNAEIGDAKLSPSGRKLAVTKAIKGGNVGLVVIDLKDPRKNKVVAHYTQLNVAQFHWAGDDRLLFRTYDPTLGGGEQWNSGWRHVAVDDDNPQLLGGYALLHVPVGSGSDVVVGDYRYEPMGRYLGVLPMRMQLPTLHVRSLAFGSPANPKHWLFDPMGEPRVVVCLQDGQSVIYWKAPGGDEWKELDRHPIFEETFLPAFVDAKGSLFVTTMEGPLQVWTLRRFDFDTGRPGEVVVSAPGFDYVGQPVFDNDGTLLGLRVTTDAQATYWFAPSMRAIQASVDALLPGRINAVDCRNCLTDNPVVLVTSWSDRAPVEFRLFDLAHKTLLSIGRSHPEIDAKSMASLDLHRMRARDGLEIPVWITSPQGTGKTAARPAVVLVHGGPWRRGRTWNWSADAQFLASRGYVVIEPEFRGSTGYGNVLFKAGWKQWGRAMQDDVADAVRWAASKGWIDARRVCIAGFGYGGYSALMGLVRNADLYRCGVAQSPLTDLRLLFDPVWARHLTADFQAYSLPILLGDEEKDATTLASTSPVELAAKIRTPLFVAIGGSDAFAPRLRKALHAAGHDPEWIEYSEESYGLLKESNRFDFARRMEAFLAKHLKD